MTDNLVAIFASISLILACVGFEMNIKKFVEECDMKDVVCNRDTIQDKINQSSS